MATFYFEPDPVTEKDQTRTPWNNKIFPGNYVAHLNSYRDQGVVAIPGAVFFRLVGALVLNPDLNDVLDANGELPAGTYDLQILSPDLRQDDKPRRNRPFALPAGATFYRTCVNAVGVREADSIAVGGVLPGTTTIRHSVSATPLLTANDGTTAGRTGTVGFFNAVGEFDYPMLSILNGTPTGDILDPDNPTPIQVITSAALQPAQDPKVNKEAGACRKSPSALIVEVCYYLPDSAPDEDDLHIPYAVEAGQGF